MAQQSLEVYINIRKCINLGRHHHEDKLINLVIWKVILGMLLEKIRIANLCGHVSNLSKANITLLLPFKLICDHALFNIFVFLFSHIQR